MIKVKCIFYNEYNDNEDDYNFKKCKLIIHCENGQILSSKWLMFNCVEKYRDNTDCSIPMLVTWSKYLIYKQFLVEVK